LGNYCPSTGYFVLYGTNLPRMEAEKGRVRMEYMKRLEPLSLLLMMLVAVNWAVDSLFDWNAINKVFGSGTAQDVVYVVVGVLALTFVPRLMEELHLGGHGAHPRGA
jgi:uncharacterized membrane protein YuzA (DUF378 family)